MIESIKAQTSPDTAALGSRPNRYTCMGCRIKFETMELQRAHYKTEWHLYNLKRRVCNLNPIDLESFEVIQASAPAKKETSKVETKINQTPDQTKDGTSSKADDIQDGDEDWEDEEVIDEELLDEDYDEEEVAEMLANVIESTRCLFCDKRSVSIERNVDHMNLAHGFFIPEDQYLIDLDGMMEYLGFKVGAGATCLWCSKQFKSVHGVRLHMLYKDHCKILYDQEKAIEEFKNFYDYSKQEQIQMKPLNQLAIPKRRVPERAGQSGGLVSKSKLSSNDRQLMARKNLGMIAGSYQAKNIKKFNAYRAKIVLRIGMANNNTMRGRLRQQNPI